MLDGEYGFPVLLRNCQSQGSFQIEHDCCYRPFIAVPFGYQLLVSSWLNIFTL